MYAKGLKTNYVTPQTFEIQELAREKAKNDLNRSTTPYESRKVEKMMPYISKTLLVNTTGATGEGILLVDTEKNKLSMAQKQAISLNFKNGKLKSSMNGNIQANLVLRRMKSII